jgi:phage major tail protein, phi13 family
MSKNKVKFGLSNVHIFPINDEENGKPIYGEAIVFKGAVNLSLDVEGDNNDFYADDIPYYNVFANNGYSGDLEMAIVTDEFRTKILGFEEDANGAIIENIDAQPKNFAMAFEFKGDKNKVRRLYYNVSASRPSDNHGTVTETVEPETETINIKAIPRTDTGDINAKLEEGQTGYDAFYEKPYEKKEKVARGDQ